MYKILPCKFYYSQAHEAFYRVRLVHPQGRSLKKLGPYLNFLTRISTGNKKNLKKCKKVKIILKKEKKIKKTKKNTHTHTKHKSFKIINEEDSKFNLITIML